VIRFKLRAGETGRHRQERVVSRSISSVHRSFYRGGLQFTNSGANQTEGGKKRKVLSGGKGTIADHSQQNDDFRGYIIELDGGGQRDRIDKDFNKTKRAGATKG